MEFSWTAIIVVLCLIKGNILAAKNKKNKDIQKKCETCRGFVNGFQEGITRTSRYNFEGGDVDWEEKRLGTYRNSETRFIEITDSICESSKFECHTLLEENEEVLEEWWKEHQHDFPDLLQWFCIDSLKYCCPNNTYGTDCNECPGGIERPCKDNGECKGSGTRAGSGKCKCNTGYSGALCDQCKANNFQDFKNDTHTVCQECHPSCLLKCSGSEAKHCEECNSGWLWNDEQGCQDVDECSSDKPPCNESEYCENNDGSYSCESCHQSCDHCLGSGDSNCIKCRRGYRMEDSTCKDICETEDHGCHGEHKLCKNTHDGHHCECTVGYELIGDDCIEIVDENAADDETADNIQNKEINDGTEEEKDINNNDTEEGNQIVNSESRQFLADDNDDDILEEGPSETKIYPKSEL